MDHKEEILDPRIKEELERLNSTSAEINRLERELDDARQLFRHTLSESSTQLNEKAKQNKRCIRRALAYHQANELAQKAHKQAQEAAHKYHRAVDLFNAAKETIACAEEAAMGNASKREFDTALQELLNFATMKLNNAEIEKKNNQAEHDKTSQTYMEAKQRVEQLAKKYKRSITKSREYYETKAVLHSKLEGIKKEVDTLQKQLHESKAKYKEALHNLEDISESIHESRRLRQILETQHRGTGVGADSGSEADVEELQVKFDLDEDNLSDVESVTNSCGGHDTPESLDIESSFSIKRTTSGCSSSGIGLLEQDTDLSINHKDNDLNERQRGDGLSPVALVSSDQPFESGKRIDPLVVSIDGKKSLGSSRSSSRADFEVSEESGLGDEDNECDNSGSDINIDDLSAESDSEDKIQRVQPKKPLRKIVPDLNKDGEVWL